ncbi:Possible ribonuclease BN [Mycobacteroides abscessus subsp. massiliense]|nr:Possible ribonuclease BN [Mycobacteroides abscessus subsp. massiliense]
MLGFAIVLGAELNAAIEENWPAGATHARQLREWLSPQNGENTAASSPDEAAPEKAPEGC